MKKTVQAKVVTSLFASILFLGAVSVAKAYLIEYDNTGGCTVFSADTGKLAGTEVAIHYADGHVERGCKVNKDTYNNLAVPMIGNPGGTAGGMLNYFANVFPDYARSATQ